MGGSSLSGRHQTLAWWHPGAALRMPGVPRSSRMVSWCCSVATPWLCFDGWSRSGIAGELREVLDKEREVRKRAREKKLAAQQVGARLATVCGWQRYLDATLQLL